MDAPSIGIDALGYWALSVSQRTIEQGAASFQSNAAGMAHDIRSEGGVLRGLIQGDEQTGSSSSVVIHSKRNSRIRQLYGHFSVSLPSSTTLPYSAGARAVPRHTSKTQFPAKAAGKVIAVDESA